LALAIDRAVAGEIRQLTVQLSPEALGSIEIALEFDGERRLSVTILAERPETLDLLRGEVRQLERLLGRQGIDLANGALELGLMSQERGQDRPAREGHGQRIAATLAAPTDEGGAAPAASPSLPSSVGGTVRRLNLSI
jgi:flagellar hook-length control protein FliK